MKRLGDFELPKTLYKFRDWNNKYHKRLLTKQLAFFASPGSFNDPYDCKIPIRYDIEPEKQLEDIYFKILKAGNPKKNENEIRKFAKKHVSEGPISPESFKKNDSEYFKKLDDRMGIFSLTKHNNDVLMWGHYANSHCGFCIGFDTTELLKLSSVDFIGKIEYCSEFPLIKPATEMTNNFEKQILSKWERWSYEDEFRLTKNHIQKREILFPKEIFKELILGCNMRPSHKKEIIQLVNKKYPAMEVFEAKPHEEKFEVEVIAIS